MGGFHLCAYCFLGLDLDKVYGEEKTRRESDFYLRALVRNLPERHGRKVVEFGAGMGRLLKRLVDYLPRPYTSLFAVEACPVLCDLGRESCEAARWFNADASEIIAASGHQAQLREMNGADAILLSQGVLLHLPDGEPPPAFEDHTARKMLQAARALLATDGFIVVDVVRYENGRPTRRGMVERHGALRLRFKDRRQAVLGESEFFGDRERCRYWRIERSQPRHPWISPWAWRCTPPPPSRGRELAVSDRLEGCRKVHGIL